MQTKLEKIGSFKITGNGARENLTPEQRAELAIARMTGRRTGLDLLLNPAW